MAAISVMLPWHLFYVICIYSTIVILKKPLIPTGGASTQWCLLTTSFFYIEPSLQSTIYKTILSDGHKWDPAQMVPGICLYPCGP